MLERLAWSLVSLLLPFMFLVTSIWSLARPKVAAAALHDLIVNEWSQGNGGAKEWVELLVVNGPADLRGWDLGDNSAGDLAFSDDVLWSNVPVGSLIVVYNGGDPDTVLPPDDADLSDCVVIMPHNDTAYFSGSWPALANTTATDNPHLRDAGDNTVHDFSVEPGSTLHPDANEHAYYSGNTAAGVSSPANWMIGSAGGATPAVGNGGANTAWIGALCSDGGANEPDLGLGKTGPPWAAPGNTLVYDITLNNSGDVLAADVLLTDTLPVGLSYVGDDSGYALNQPAPGVLVWSIGSMPAGMAVSFHLTVSVGAAVSGVVTNEAVVTTSVAESNTSNNTASASIMVNGNSVWLDAVLYDGYETNDIDEAVALRNMGNSNAAIENWQLSDGQSMVTLPAGATLEPGQVMWLTKDGAAFSRQFGFAPDFEVTNSDPAIPDLLGTWPGFSNSGDEVLLLTAGGAPADVLVYKSGNSGQDGWSGAAVEPYKVTSVFTEEGQILYRRRDQATGLPVPDTNTAADWAQMRDDVINGRKVRYPGWDLDTFFFTGRLTETAVLTVAVAPDNAYQAIVNEIEAASSSIRIESLTFENVAIGDALVAAVNRGVSVTVLLEGAPVGGLIDQERHICQQLEVAGGQCWFIISDSAATIFDRYRFLHAKFMLIDGQRVVISSENLSPNSLPDDDKSDGTVGRRGVVLITDAPGVVSHVQNIFDLDLDLKAAPGDAEGHLDLFRWQAGHPTYGAPSSGFVPITVTGGVTYTVRYNAPSRFVGTFAFEIVQSPENSLRDQDGLLGLVGRASAGDTILVQQLSERPYWGSTTSNSTADPNPRLEAYIAAARRGATVRLLLDEYFDSQSDPVSNFVTCGYVNAIAHTENLALECALANPAGLGIHNKMVLAQINGRGFIHAGSINGTEQSNKGNREVALQVQSDGAYALLADMFTRDWPHRVYLPVGLNNAIGPASHVLISEVLYDPFGLDDAEFIELVNPTSGSVDLSYYGLGDAVNRSDFEDVRRFPIGTVLAPRATLIVATSATAFKTAYGFSPTFEVVNSDLAVPDLIDDVTWGDPAALLQLGNGGDEVILRNSVDQVIDVVTYGSGAYPGLAPCALVTADNHSLERFPYWRDTDDCAFDFRDWPFPNPGSLP